MKSHLANALLLVTLGALLWPVSVVSYETDQYSNRELPLADSAEFLNERVNSALVEIAGEWERGPNERAFAKAVYKKLGGRHWVDRLERWAIQSEEVAKASVKRRQSIYRGLPFWATRVNFVFGVGPTIRLGDTRLGTDKIGHFISQGWKYHRRGLRGLSEEKVVRLGIRNEASIFGSPATGSFSNADLVANYEGYLFFRSLFEDGIVVEKTAIIAWTPEGGAQLQRSFDIRDHVNDYWDEALNPNRFDRLLRGPMRKRLVKFCADYEAQPSAYVPANDAELHTRYLGLGMRDGSGHRLDRVCGPDDALALQSSPQ